MPKPLVLVTGKNGQLGWELLQLQEQYAGTFDFLFTDRATLNLEQPASIGHVFADYQPAYCIHGAAYTAVDKAESEQELAYRINALAVSEIAMQCKKYGTKLITISTDYVFNGQATMPYQPKDATNPVNYYGYTKWMGEQMALANHAETLVIRTSWVYSEHGHNFVKTMLRLMKERTDINVVADQLGAPTYAADLAEACLKIITQWHQGKQQYGIYHYSNKGLISWYDFALTIQKLAGLSCTIHPIPTSAYPTPAKRPAFSGMDSSDIENDFGLVIPEWSESIQRCLSRLK